MDKLRSVTHPSDHMEDYRLKTWPPTFENEKAKALAAFRENEMQYANLLYNYDMYVASVGTGGVQVPEEQLSRFSACCLVGANAIRAQYYSLQKEHEQAMDELCKIHPYEATQPYVPMSPSFIEAFVLMSD